MVSVHFLLERVLSVDVPLLESIASVHSVPPVAWLDVKAIRSKSELASFLFYFEEELVLLFLLLLSHFLELAYFPEWIYESIF